ncbi:MAG TPA: hypothetical protein VIK74_01595 [Parasegetibacter sp.]|jgi:hypothetical protein
MKYNQSTLTRIERILGDVEYVIRYERGNFQSGYCVLENKKVVVLNKFLPLDGRINALIDIIASLDINQDYLSPESKKMYAEILAKYEESQ